MKSVHEVSHSEQQNEASLLKIVRRKIIKNCAERMLTEQAVQSDTGEILSAEEKELCGII